MLSTSASVNLLSGVHLSTLYLILAIALTGVSLYIAIKKNRQESKTQFSDSITEKVLAESKNEIAETVKAAVITEVKEAIASIDYKITRNGKNTDNLGDVAARTEEKVDGLKNTVEILAATVTITNERLVEHIGWHKGFNDSKKKDR